MGEESPRQGSRDAEGKLEERKDLLWSLSKEELRWGRVWGFLLEKMECEMRPSCQPPERH